MDFQTPSSVDEVAYREGDFVVFETSWLNFGTIQQSKDCAFFPNNRFKGLLVWDELLNEEPKTKNSKKALHRSM